MLLVVVLLPLSLLVCDSEFGHGGGRGGCGSQTAVAVAGVEALEDNLSAKAAGNNSVDGRMTACDDEIRWRTTTQQPTNERHVTTPPNSDDMKILSFAVDGTSFLVKLKCMLVRWQVRE